MLRHWTSVFLLSVAIGTVLAHSATARCPIATRYQPRLWATTSQSLSGNYDYRGEFDYLWSVTPRPIAAPASHLGVTAAPKTADEPLVKIPSPQPVPAESTLGQTKSK